LVNFIGTDNVPAIVAARKYYNCSMAGYSVPAAEHSTITSWRKEAETAAYRNMIDQFKGFGNKIVAIVADSYDLDNAVINIFGGSLKDIIVNSGARIVVRPDSGNPASTVARTVNNLAEKFGTTVNSKGYRVLPNYIRVIQGDGINLDSIFQICFTLQNHGFSVENVCFGMGGGLLQQLDRDTQKFAMKASAICTDKIWFDINKDPKTDPGKASKKGRLMLYRDNDGKYTTDIVGKLEYKNEALQTVYRKDEDGLLICDVDTLDNIRSRSSFWV
jgi:nicotinamide phosphoribosyltransferase